MERSWWVERGFTHGRVASGVVDDAHVLDKEGDVTAAKAHGMQHDGHERHLLHTLFELVERRERRCGRGCGIALGAGLGYVRRVLARRHVDRVLVLYELPSVYLDLSPVLKEEARGLGGRAEDLLRGCHYERVRVRIRPLHRLCDAGRAGDGRERDALH